MTGSHSKGKSKRILNYRCRYCKRQNHNANRAHDWMDQILSDISIPKQFFNHLSKMVDAKYDSYLEQLRNRKIELTKEYTQTDIKLERLEKKYIEDGSIDKKTYNKWRLRYQTELNTIDLQLTEINSQLITKKFNLKTYTSSFTNFQMVYEKMETSTKQLFLNQVFDNKLYLTKEGYRTPYRPVLLFDKEKSINWLEIEKGKPDCKNTIDFPFAARKGNTTNPDTVIHHLLSLSNIFKTIA